MLVNILSKIFFPLVASLTNCLRLKELHNWRCLNWLKSPAKIIPAPGLLERTESIDSVRCARRALSSLLGGWYTIPNTIEFRHEASGEVLRVTKATRIHDFQSL